MVQMQLWPWTPKPFTSGPVLTSEIVQRPTWAHPWPLALTNLDSVLSLASLCYSFSAFPAVLIPPHSWAPSSSFHNHFYGIPLVESLMILKALEIH